MRIATISASREFSASDKVKTAAFSLISRSSFTPFTVLK
jgi:hypothetical protein